MPGIGAAIFAMLTGRNYRSIEFRTNYQRYTPEMSASLLRIGTALGMIQGARILPAVADELRASARAITVHYSNLIEGNQLPLIEAERATRGELNPDSRAKVELINYVEALSRIDEAIANDEAVFTPDFFMARRRMASAARTIPISSLDMKANGVMESRWSRTD